MKIIEMLSKYGYLDINDDVKYFIDNYPCKYDYYLFSIKKQLCACIVDYTKENPYLIDKKEIKTQTIFREHKLKRILK